LLQVEQKVPWCYYPQNTGYYVVKESDAGKHWKKTPGAVKNPYCNDADTLNFEQTQIGAGIRLVIGEDDRSDLNVKN
jgi:hypothetical protein